ncbi:MAG: hypothetical protein U5J82_03420 [Desulfobacterales bacterium]|nr:hypothetical protein [Desulfobacterales bacterium]
MLASEVSFICVGTPSQRNGNLDLKYVRRVCEDIGRALKKKPEFHLVVMRKHGPSRNHAQCRYTHIGGILVKKNG